MQAEWSKAETITDRYENLLILLQSYHASMLQSFIDAENLATELVRLLPQEGKKKSFLGSFLEMQVTLRGVAQDLLSERFAAKTQEPVRERIEAIGRLEKLEKQRRQLWQRYQKDMERYKALLEEEEREKNSSSGSTQASDRARRMKMIVDKEFKLYHDCKDYITAELESFCSSNASVIEPMVATLTLLQCQTFTLGNNLVGEVIQRNPDTHKFDLEKVSRRNQLEQFETQLSFLLTHEIDLDDLSVKEVTPEVPDATLQKEQEPAKVGTVEDKVAAVLPTVEKAREVVESESEGKSLEEIPLVRVGGLETPKRIVSEEEGPHNGENGTENLSAPNRTPVVEAPQPVVLRTVESMFDFTSEEDIELSLKRGELIDVYRMTLDGWWEGRSKESGRVGLFPYNFVRSTHMD